MDLSWVYYRKYSQRFREPLPALYAWRCLDCFGPVIDYSDLCHHIHEANEFPATECYHAFFL